MEEKKPYYPPEWDNDQSMTVLFSPFRENRDVNPQSWDKKMKFWTDLIFQDCSHCKSGLIDANSLPLKFQRKGKTPVCISVVLQELFRQGKIQRLTDFKAGVNVGWISWSFGVFVRKPLSWTFGKLFGGGSNEIIDGDFVFVDVVKTQAENVLERHHSSVKNDLTDHVVEYNRLREQCQDICLDDDSLQLVLLQLIKDGKAVITQTDKQERIVRFAKQDKRSVSPISELELKVMRLQKAEEKIQNQVLQANEEMERCRTDAKFYLAKGMKNSAKNALRRKKTMERVMEKREGALETLHSLIQKIKDAESDKMVLDAYAAGSSALKEIFDTHNLSTDNIDDVMCDVQETFDIHEEINESMAQGVQDPALDVSTADLEAELEELLSGDTSQPEAKVEGESDDLMGRMEALKVTEEIGDLPSVPTFDPATPPKATKVLARSPLKPSPVLVQTSVPQSQPYVPNMARTSPQASGIKPVGFSPSGSPESSYGQSPSFTSDSSRRDIGQGQFGGYDQFGAQGQFGGHGQFGGQGQYGGQGQFRGHGQFGGQGDHYHSYQRESPNSAFRPADRSPLGNMGFSNQDSSFPSPPRRNPRAMPGGGEMFLGPNPPTGFPQDSPPRREPHGEYRKYHGQMHYGQ